MTESRAEHSAKVIIRLIVTNGDYRSEFGVSRIGPHMVGIREATNFPSQCNGTIFISVDGVTNSFHCRFPNGIKAGDESTTRYVKL
jgi:hypothetical protein